MKKLRIGFVGAGAMGQAAHLRNYASRRDCEVVALCEVRPQLAASVAARYNIPATYADADVMLREAELDGIVAIQMFHNHADIIPPLLTKGVPVLTEKPLADNVERGEAILRAAEATGTPLYLAYHKRSDPAIQYAVDRIAAWTVSGEVGAMTYVRITMPPGDWMANGFRGNIETGETYASSTVDWNDPYIQFVNYYIHQVNLFRWLLGENYQVAYADPAGVLMTIRSDSGIPGTLEMAPYATSLGWQESVFVAFQRGWIRVDLPSPLVLNQAGKVTVYADVAGKTPRTWSPELPPKHAMHCQARNFLRAIRGESHPLCLAADGLLDLKVARQYLALKGA